MIDRIDTIRYVLHLRYDLMGIIPRGESPWGWAPTIRSWMATDAINVSETTYMTAVRYYLANLGTTMESQVRSSVPSVYSVVSSVNASLLPIHQFRKSLFPFLHLAVCRASSLAPPAIPSRTNS